MAKNSKIMTLSSLVLATAISGGCGLYDSNPNIRYAGGIPVYVSDGRLIPTEAHDMSCTTYKAKPKGSAGKERTMTLCTCYNPDPSLPASERTYACGDKR